MAAAQGRISSNDHRQTSGSRHPALSRPTSRPGWRPTSTPCSTPRTGSTTAPALIKAAAGCDGIMCAAGDPLTAETIAGLPASVRIIATFSVGYEHVDVAAAAKRGIVVTNTPDVLTDATADIALLCLLGAARRAHEGTTMLRTAQLGRLDADPAHGHARHRQATRYPGHGPHRPGGGRAGARLPHADPLQQPLAPAGRPREGRDLPRQPRRHAAALRLPVDQRADDAGDAQMGQCRAHRQAAQGGDRGEHGARRRGRRRGADRGAEERAGWPPPASTCSTASPRSTRATTGCANAFLLPHMGSATVETRNAMGFKALDNLEAFLLRKQAPPDAVKAS